MSGASELFVKNNVYYEIAGYYSLRDTLDLYSNEIVDDFCCHEFLKSYELHKSIERFKKEATFYPVFTRSPQSEHDKKDGIEHVSVHLVLGGIDGDFYRYTTPALFKTFGLDHNDCIAIGGYAKNGTLIILKKTDRKVSVFEKSEKDPVKFINNHLSRGGSIHRLRNNIRSVIDFLKSSGNMIDEDRAPITTASLHHFVKNKPSPQQKPTEQTTHKIDKSFSIKQMKSAANMRSRKELTPIILEDEYSDELKSLRAAIIAKTKGRGGCVDVQYGDMTLSIPKKPFLNWMLKFSKEDTRPDMLWRPLSPLCLKTDSDCQYHSDWWIGAGLPLYAYQLSDGFDFFKYGELNDILKNESIRLANLLVGRTKMDSIRYRLGGTDCSEKEMRSVAQSYTTKGLAQHLPMQSITQLLEQQGFKIERLING